ncbi:DUF4865 family protein [Streptomyces lichenis]|uniref:DUF4865 family protein n=1 Tax=Streptomyces lichenis TaxID=2306967 RepID=A0ABT0IHH7_9ACTN|nr:DUF4865 family protein [Streptomyces lichenis]MCK8680779.1 DUF4865 family protein [Streptomyces lichenis]
MLAMQYEIGLPADYDMDVIRHRVATRGRLLDDFPGLGFKAYLIRDRADGAPVNAYAPFYLWRAPEGMNAFLWGAGFQGIVDDFGRPPVRQWPGLAYREGAAAAAAPQWATRRLLRIDQDASPARAVEAAEEEHERLARREGVVAAVAAVDASRWEVLRLALWAGEAPEDEGEVYRVLHLSEPERSRLPQGRLR